MRQAWEFGGASRFLKEKGALRAAQWVIHGIESPFGGRAVKFAAGLPFPLPLLPFFRDGVDFEYALRVSISAMAVFGVEASYCDRIAPI